VKVHHYNVRAVWRDPAGGFTDIVRSTYPNEVLESVVIGMQAAMGLALSPDAKIKDLEWQAWPIERPTQAPTVSQAPMGDMEVRL
jgi:hypothetical protein